MRLVTTLVALSFAASTSAFTQTNTGEIGGVVRDESGGVLPGATVVATHPASGFTIERVTDADGRFFMASLPIGAWEITAELVRSNAIRCPLSELHHRLTRNW